MRGFLEPHRPHINTYADNYANSFCHEISSPIRTLQSAHGHILVMIPFLLIQIGPSGSGKTTLLGKSWFLKPSCNMGLCCSHAAMTFQ